MGYFDRGFATVTYDEEDDVVLAHMTDFAEGEPFREYMYSIIEAIEDTGTHQVLTDTSDMGTITQEDQEWSAVEWTPEAEAAGLKRMAMVMPESVVAEISVEQILEMTDDEIERDLFDNVEDAREWIRNGS